MGRQAPARIVVKVGSGVVAPAGRLDPVAVATIAREIAAARDRGTRVVLVSSGAVAAGFRDLGLGAMPRSIREKQAAAAVGQPRLLAAYADAMRAHELVPAQVLLTSDDFDHRQRFLNARHTLETLLEHGLVPIINENDSVAFDEIRLGDNDRLSALVASAIDADLLVLLSVAPGVVDKSTGKVIPEITDTDAARAHIDVATSDTGTGGMATKLDAADIAIGHAVPVVIAPGRPADGADPLTPILDGQPVGTRFPVPPDARGPAARKSWIAFSTQTRGAIVIDEGAARALREKGASLLPKGVVGVEGRFDVGAPVEIRTEGGALVARGLATYASHELERVKGKRSDEIESVLGYAYAPEAVHRDDMHVLGDPA
ncbi:MAG: glutamate 5-kinase [Phycisphaerales bacterium]